LRKYKVCVYAICKNEEKFVERWYNSMSEADEIYVLDTGSEDETVKRLEEHGVHVKVKVFEPWRFDVARNESLEMVPLDCDICVCTDLDEVFQTGWRDALERVWEEDANRCRYIYNWSLKEDNSPIISFYYEKIHSRKNYRWIYPVHEILEYANGDEKYVLTNEIVLNHYPDPTKSRGSYLSLLELSVQEHPESDRNRHYLGREYMFHCKWNEAIDTLISHLQLKNATWKDERAASMRFIARCYQRLSRMDEARMWLGKAIQEAPYLRDGYVEMAMLEYHQNNWQAVYEYCKMASNIEINQRSYINEAFTFDETVDDLLSISCFYMGKYDEALIHVKKALEINPNSERIQHNKDLIEQFFNEDQFISLEEDDILKAENLITDSCRQKKEEDLISEWQEG